MCRRVVTLQHQENRGPRSDLHEVRNVVVDGDYGGWRMSGLFFLLRKWDRVQTVGEGEEDGARFVCRKVRGGANGLPLLVHQELKD